MGFPFSRILESRFMELCELVRKAAAELPHSTGANLDMCQFGCQLIQKLAPAAFAQLGAVGALKVGALLGEDKERSNFGGK